jgi:hypothetical protein
MEDVIPKMVKSEDTKLKLLRFRRYKIEIDKR